MYAAVDYDDGDVVSAEPSDGVEEVRREMAAEIGCRSAEYEDWCVYRKYGR